MRLQELELSVVRGRYRILAVAAQFLFLLATRETQWSIPIDLNVSRGKAPVIHLQDTVYLKKLAKL